MTDRSCTFGWFYYFRDNDNRIIGQQNGQATAPRWPGRCPRCIRVRGDRTARGRRIAAPPPPHLRFGHCRGCGTRRAASVQRARSCDAPSHRERMDRCTVGVCHRPRGVRTAWATAHLNLKLCAEYLFIQLLPSPRNGCMPGTSLASNCAWHSARSSAVMP